MSKRKDSREPWIEAVGSSLRGMESPTAAAGWQRLEEALAAGAAAGGAGAAGGQRKAAAVPLWRRYGRAAAVAAAVLLLVGTWMVAGRLSGPEDAGVKPADPVAVAGPSAGEAEPAAESGPESGPEAADGTADRTQPLRSRMQQGGAKGANPTQLLAVATVADAHGEPAAEAVAEVPETVGAQHLPAEDAREPRTETIPLIEVPEADEACSLPEQQPAAVEDPFRSEWQPPRRSRRRTGVGVSVAGGMAVADATRSGGTVMLSAAMFVPPPLASDLEDPVAQSIYSQGNLYILSETADWSCNHKIPLSFGLTVDQPLGRRFSLSTGAVYTLLRSEVRIAENTDAMQQSLHFLGIPLRAEWRFFERSGFSLYLGAGGMVEKCIGGKLGSDAVTIRPLQWSVNGSVGARYALTRHISLYFEPEASCYLSDSDLRTVRTDSPVTLSLRLGLRFTR